jgi:hypothetical protein
LRARVEDRALATHVTVDYLTWRYGSGPVDYRAVVGRDGLRSGLAIFRTRRRGPARETVLCEVFSPTGERGLRRDLLRRVVQAADSDYVLALGRRPISSGGFVRLPRQGPILTARSVAEDRLAPRPEWRLHLGDVELF